MSSNTLRKVQGTLFALSLVALGAGCKTSQSTANAQQSGASGQAFQEQETVIHLKREEPVVETEVVPSGRIVVQRKTEPQQQSVQRQIRREDIQVQKSGNADNVIISDN